MNSKSHTRNKMTEGFHLIRLWGGALPTRDEEMRREGPTEQHQGEDWGGQLRDTRTHEPAGQEESREVEEVKT